MQLFLSKKVSLVNFFITFYLHFFFYKKCEKNIFLGETLNYIYFIPHFSFTNLLYCAIILCTRFLSIILESSQFLGIKLLIILYARKNGYFPPLFQPPKTF